MVNRLSRITVIGAFMLAWPQFGVAGTTAPPGLKMAEPQDPHELIPTDGIINPHLQYLAVDDAFDHVFEEWVDKDGRHQEQSFADKLYFNVASDGKSLLMGGMNAPARALNELRELTSAIILPINAHDGAVQNLLDARLAARSEFGALYAHGASLFTSNRTGSGPQANLVFNSAGKVTACLFQGHSPHSSREFMVRRNGRNNPIDLTPRGMESEIEEAYQAFVFHHELAHCVDPVIAIERLPREAIELYQDGGITAMELVVYSIYLSEQLADLNAALQLKKSHGDAIITAIEIMRNMDTVQKINLTHDTGRAIRHMNDTVSQASLQNLSHTELFHLASELRMQAMGLGLIESATQFRDHVRMARQYHARHAMPALRNTEHFLMTAQRINELVHDYVTVPVNLLKPTHAGSESVARTRSGD